MIAHAQIDVTGGVELTSETEADLIRVSPNNGDGEVYLPPAGDVLGRRYTVRRAAGFGNVYVFPASDSGETIDGEERLVIGSRPVTVQAARVAPETFAYERV